MEGLVVPLLSTFQAGGDFINFLPELVHIFPLADFILTIFGSHESSLHTVSEPSPYPPRRPF